MPQFDVYAGDRRVAIDIEGESADAVALEASQHWTHDEPIEVYEIAHSPARPGSFAYANRFANQLRNAALLIETVPALAPQTPEFLGDYLYNYQGDPLARFQRFAAAAAEAAGKADVTPVRRQTSNHLEISIDLGGLVKIGARIEPDALRPGPPQPPVEWPVLIAELVPETVE